MITALLVFLLIFVMIGVCCLVAILSQLEQANKYLYQVAVIQTINYLVAAGYRIDADIDNNNGSIVKWKATKK